MPTYRLQALLDVREAALAAAERALARAVTGRAEAEDLQARLDEDAAAARERAACERRAGPTAGLPSRTVSDLQARQRWLDRLDAGAEKAAKEAATHRRGPLEDAARAEEDARQAHLAARREREVVARHKEAEAAAGRRLAEARLEAALEDLVAGRR